MHLTVTLTISPGDKVPRCGVTWYASGDVVFTCTITKVQGSAALEVVGAQKFKKMQR